MSLCLLYDLITNSEMGYAFFRHYIHAPVMAVFFVLKSVLKLENSYKFDKYLLILNENGDKNAKHYKI